MECTNDIATVINRKPETLTITRLMELMEGQPKVKKRLAIPIGKSSIVNTIEIKLSSNNLSVKSIIILEEELIFYKCSHTKSIME